MTSVPDQLLDLVPMRAGVHWSIRRLSDDLDAWAVVENSRGLGFVVTAYALEAEGCLDMLRHLANAVLLGQQSPDAPNLDLEGPTQESTA